MPVNKDGFGLHETLVAAIEQIAIAVVNEIAPGASGVSSVGGATGAVTLRTVGGITLTDGGGDIPLGSGAVSSVNGDTGAIVLRTVGGIDLADGGGDIPVTGASAWDDLTDKDSADLPTDNTPLADALAAKADRFDPVNLGTGAISLNAADHANRPLRWNGTSPQTVAIDASAGIAGDIYSILNLGTAILTMPGVAGDDYQLTIKPNSPGAVEWVSSSLFVSWIPKPGTGGGGGGSGLLDANSVADQAPLNLDEQGYLDWYFWRSSSTGSADKSMFDGVGLDWTATGTCVRQTGATDFQGYDWNGTEQDGASSPASGVDDVGSYHVVGTGVGTLLITAEGETGVEKKFTLVLGVYDDGAPPTVTFDLDDDSVTPIVLVPSGGEIEFTTYECVFTCDTGVKARIVVGVTDSPATSAIFPKVMSLENN